MIQNRKAEKQNRNAHQKGKTRVVEIINILSETNNVHCDYFYPIKKN